MTGWQRPLAGHLATDRAESTPKSIPRHRRAVRTADGEGHRWRHLRGIVKMSTPQHGGPHSAPRVGQFIELLASADPMDQADRRARPLARRDLSTARPARVLIRARKPCFLARRCWLGWNVRFTCGVLSSMPAFDAPIGPDDDIGVRLGKATGSVPQTATIYATRRYPASGRSGLSPLAEAGAWRASVPSLLSSDECRRQQFIWRNSRDLRRYPQRVEKPVVNVISVIRATPGSADPAIITEQCRRSTIEIRPP